MSVALQRLARQRIGDGKLPPAEKFRSFGGEGSGRRCALCDSEIGRDVMEIEIEVAGNAEPPLAFHVGCFSAWSAATVQED